MSFALSVSGDAACFRRPEFARDCITYDVITPISARGIFEAIHWTPAIRWWIESIEVLNRIAHDQSGGPDSAERLTLNLRDVSYIIKGRFELTAAAGAADSAAQHAAMFQRRARTGRFFRPPYLGRREFPAIVTLSASSQTQTSRYYAGSGHVDLGWMIFDYSDGPDRELTFYRPTMVDGVINVAPVDAALLAR